MEIKQKKYNDIIILYLIGKLDGFQANLLENKVNMLIDKGDYKFIMVLEGLDYLSSAGIRILLKLMKKCCKLGGEISLASVAPYPLNVLKIAGFQKVINVYDTLEIALSHMSNSSEDQKPDESNIHKISSGIGEFCFRRSSDMPSRLRITGSNENFLKSRSTLNDLETAPLSTIDFSLGIGALGSKPEDNFNIMGELMIINGSVVWLPTDGHSTPDFLIASGETSDINVHTAFNLSLQGNFNAIIRFTSEHPEGVTISSLYTELFKIIGEKFRTYKGIIGTVIRADIGAVFGAGIKIAPILDNKPANNEFITHRENIKDWLDFQLDFEHNNTTALIVGLGLDLSSGTIIPGYKSVFHINEKDSRKQYLHNHAAIFKFIPERIQAEKDLKGEIDYVLNEGEFLSMQHLLDQTTLKKSVDQHFLY